MRLFDGEGRRLYFTEDERRAFMAAASKAPRDVRTFCAVLHSTGCRISEALAFPNLGRDREISTEESGPDLGHQLLAGVT